MKSIKKEIEISKKPFSLETGGLAFQANGAVLAKYGGTEILATVVLQENIREDIDYLPLMVDYEERFYAAGKIKGSRFIKREGRPTDDAVLTGRVVDRSIRPFFDENIRNDIQIILTVLSIDGENDPEVVSPVAASAALLVSGIPFSGPISCVKIGKINDKWQINPSVADAEKASCLVTVSGTKEKIAMIEADASEAEEKDVIFACKTAHDYIKKLSNLQEELVKETEKAEGKNSKKELLPSKIIKEEDASSEVLDKVKKEIEAKLEKALFVKNMEERETNIAKMQEDLIEKLASGKEGSVFTEANIKKALDKIIKDKVRKEILENKKRVDGRALDEVRPISCEVGNLSRTHGSGLFTRGRTQALSVVTLGSSGQVQLIDTMEEEGEKRYMHHYNFPPFCSGEVMPLRAPSRREIGHGALAEKALIPVLPEKEDFPYTIRVVTEILSSNGSTSMASTCGSSLALMDAGVPIKAPVSGVAMGLVAEDEKDITKGGKYEILTDIAGLEDYKGDMDFKVTGTRKGITAIQMDVKTSGLTPKIISETLEKAKKARLKILDIMESVIPEPRKELSPYAPRIYTIEINPERIRDVIGPGGKMINKIIAETGVEIDIEDTGLVMVCSVDKDSADKAVRWIKDLTREVAVGEKFEGKVTRITNFGAFVEILPGQEGLVHISQFSDRRIRKVEDVVKVGDMIPVIVVEIDEMGRINLSHKAALGPEDKKQDRRPRRF